MTTYLDNYNSILYQTTSTDQYNGVLRVSNGTTYGTGTLLYDGCSILTAAHIFNGISDENTNVYIYNTLTNEKLKASISIYDGYSSKNATGDIAIVTLDESYNQDFSRYELYRDNDEIGKIFTMVGYGQNGTGRNGSNNNTASDNFKLKANNKFEVDFYDIGTASTTNLSWYPSKDTVLAADFDNSLIQNDALGFAMDIEDTGVGETEGMIALGDSGGPAFLDSKVAGVASYITVVGNSTFNPDINDTQDSSFGEIGAWQRVSHYQEWIDKTIRANYEDAPTSKEDVKISVQEANSGISYAYFFVEYTLARSTEEGVISVDYSTRNGTATAGEDYISTSGTLNLYSDETSAVIAVEIIGDNLIENDEYFYLDVTNPINASFGNNVNTLTATRTIVDDDGFFI